MVAYTGQKESSLFGLVDGIPPSIAHIFLLNLAGWHSSDKLRPVDALGGRMLVQLDSVIGDVPLLWVAWSYTETTKGRTGLLLFIIYESPNICDFRVSHIRTC